MNVKTQMYKRICMYVCVSMYKQSVQRKAFLVHKPFIYAYQLHIAVAVVRAGFYLLAASETNRIHFSGTGHHCTNVDFLFLPTVQVG